MIEDSGNFRGSPWNIQGNKKLTNVSFAYFTCLDSITTQADLTQIAMANDGKIYLMVDGFNPPADLTPRTAESKYANEILTLEVYREDTANRTAAKKHGSKVKILRVNTFFTIVPLVLLPTTKSVVRHLPSWFTPNKVLGYDIRTEKVNSDSVKQLYSHVVAGDATSLKRAQSTV